MRKHSMLLLFMLFFVLPLSNVHSADISNSRFLKVTVIADGVETEWEYHNPDEYEVEIGNHVIKNEEAKKEVTKMFNQLNISQTPDIQEMVDTLKRHGMNVERLDIRWKDKDDQLFTWLWEKNEND